MSEEITRDLPDGRSFEAAVLSRLDAISQTLQSLDSRVHNLETRVDEVDVRLQKLEARAYDTKPIWERALKEIVDTRRELSHTRRDLSRRLDRFEAVVLGTRADLRDAEDLIDRLEAPPPS